MADDQQFEDGGSGALSEAELDVLMNSVGGDESSSEDAGSTTQANSYAGHAEEEGGADAYHDDPLADALGGGRSAAAAASSAGLRMSTFANAAPAEGLNGFDRVQDIPLELTVELGRTRLLIKDILELGSGSIVELEKIAGEPVDLLANGLLIARGEVVVIEDSFGVRITEIITSAERQAIGSGAGAQQPSSAYSAAQAA